MNWFALLVPPQAEFRAEEALKRRGYQVFVPHEYKWRRVSRYAKRRRVNKKYALLVRYVFIAFDGLPPWRTIADLDGIKGIARLVGTSLGPLQLRAEEVLHLMRLCGEAPGYAQSPNPHKALKVGDAVRIVGGSFHGHETTVDKIDAKRARVFLEFLGSMQSVEIPVEALEAA